MPFELIKVENKSDPNDEYVLLRATGEKNNLFGYAIVDKTFFPSGNVSNKFRHIYRFHDIQVKKGEYVFLISGKGKYNYFKDRDGDWVHYVYWNSNECIWNNTGDTAYLIRYETKAEAIVPAVKK